MLFYFCKRFAALHWKYIEKEMQELPNSVFTMCLHEHVQKEITNHMEVELLFNRIEQVEQGVDDHLDEMFKIRSKMWWLQRDKHAN